MTEWRECTLEYMHKSLGVQCFGLTLLFYNKYKFQFTSEKSDGKSEIFHRESKIPQRMKELKLY